MGQNVKEKPDKTEKGLTGRGLSCKYKTGGVSD
jgi:hypothetical protein